MDNWEERMEVLNQQQQAIEKFIQVVYNHHDHLRPGRPLDQIVKTQAPGVILTMVENNALHHYALLAAIQIHQIEFNKAVIAMLTDLDNRKVESP